MLQTNCRSIYLYQPKDPICDFAHGELCKYFLKTGEIVIFPVSKKKKFSWSNLVLIWLPMQMVYSRWVARVAQISKSVNLPSKVVSSLPEAGGVFPWYRALASLSFQFASVPSNHHTINKRCPN